MEDSIRFLSADSEMTDTQILNLMFTVLDDDLIDERTRSRIVEEFADRIPA